MQRQRFVVSALLTVTMVGFLSGTAHALTLTPAGSTAGFSLSTFATGFPSTGICCGPLGIVNSGAGVLVADYPGNVRLFATDTDGQTAGLAPVGQSYGLSNAIGLAATGGKIYMTQEGNGQVVEVTGTGAFVQNVVTGISFATGIAVNPVNGHLFISNSQNGQIFDVDPLLKTTSVFTNIAADGLSVSGNGDTLYAALNNGHIMGFDTSTKSPVFDSGFVPGGIDGTAIGTGSLAGNIFANTNDGHIVKINLLDHGTTVIAEGGSRGDFVALDTNNGTLLLTQTDSIVRLQGGGFGTMPEPATVLLFGTGLIGIFVARRFKNG